MPLFQRIELYWQQPGYEDADPDDEDVEELLDEFDDDEEFIERDGMLFCGACGTLACPGEEEFDWCDHRTGQGCYHMQESVFSDDDDTETGSEYDRHTRKGRANDARNT